jgi:hypothetical protein
MTNSRGSAAKPVALDRVFEAYRASGDGFRKAFEDADRYVKLNRLMLPSLVKLALQGLAMLTGAGELGRRGQGIMQ